IYISKTASALSKGLLMDARGNSGVILSQLFRGFSKYIAAETELSALKFAEALQHGVETAYKAVMKPVEGTILTVAKDAAAKGMETAKTEENIIAWFETVLAEAQASLERTPDLLPVLKEVGVVDSGGQGLVYVYEGFLASLKGEELPEKHAHNSMTDLVSAEHHKNIASFVDTADIEFGYCTEFMVKFEKGKKEFNEALFRSDLSEYGDSLLVIADDEIAKIHIHSEEPGKVLTNGQDYGSLISMKIENMRQQHIDIVGEDFQKNAPKQQTVQPYAVVTVAMGEGIADLLRSIGASYVIESRQTMNPSTECNVNAVKSIGAERVLILPNNKNIIMAAEQAAELLDIEAAVVPTKDVPQGMSALLAFNPDASVEDNQAAMASASKHVKSGSVTFAVRDTSIDGIEIKKDDFMGISEGKIVVSDSNLDSVTEKLAKQLVDSEAEIVTILFGEDVTAADAEKLGQFIETLNSDVEVEIHEGKQPLYPFIIAVE